MLNKNIMILSSFVVIGASATSFELNSNGISHVYFPINDSRSNWYVATGSSWHKGSDTYADDWNLKYGLTAGIESSTSCDRDRGAEVISSFSGKVILADTSGNIGAYGKEVIVQSSQNNGFAMRYSHLDSVYVSNEEEVSVGTLLGTVGDSGTDCAHLHLVLYQNLNTTALNRLKIGNSPKSLSGAADTFAAKFYTDATTGGTNQNPVNTNEISRAKSLKLILDKFEISTKNAGFNKSRFGKTITLPNDVIRSTSNYDAIVVGYNRGIVNGTNEGKFEPNRAVSLEEFITMIVRTIPIPLDNPKYQSYPYSDSKYLKAAYNAKILDNKSYDFDKGIDEPTANSLLNKAFEYFRGDKSGISIYLKWNKQYVDLDMYAYSPADSSNIEIEKDDNGYISNMGELNSYNNLLYYGKHSTNWGANLDYDSWGGNGSQPWAGFGEERATVDSLMVKRPGKYSFIICYYDWSSTQNPSSANYEMIGYKGSKNITKGGSLKGTIDKGQCKVGGTLTTN